MASEVDIVRFKLKREVKAREEAERLLEEKSREIYKAAEQVKRMALFAKLNPGPVMRFDETGHVIFVNPAAEEIFGKDTVIGKSINSLFDFDSCKFQSCLMEGGICHKELLIKEKFYTFTFRGFKELKIINAYGSDITLLKLAEQQSREKEYAATMWQVASGVGHEVGNALLAVNGFKNRLKKVITKLKGQVDVDLYAKAEKLLAGTSNELQRANRIVETMSGLNRTNPEPTTFRVFNLLEDVIEAIRWRDRSVKFSVTTRAEDITVHADIDSVRQVLINLIKNAVYATKGQENRQVSAIVYGGTGKVAIEISDNGIGIPNEVKDRIFDNLFTSKPRGEGTGIGLSLCKKLAEENRGSLDLKWTEPGQGSTFALMLPVKEEG